MNHLEDIDTLIDHLVAVTVRSCSPDSSKPTDIKAIKDTQNKTVQAIDTLILRGKIEAFNKLHQLWEDFAKNHDVEEVPYYALFYNYRAELKVELEASVKEGKND